ncbi:MAG: TonB-dependent receptor [Sphingomicrobium sp.]
MPALPIDTGQIVITASRSPETEAATAASVTVIDAERIARLGEPLVPALLRLTPSASISVSGPAGSLTEVRIRGAEANHTLLFIDGIRANDPAAGNTPRFELLNADIASRVEVVRGPQSALWGSEAIGGVIAVNGIADAPGYGAHAEGGSFGFARASAHAAVQSGAASAAGAIGFQRATGIDSFSGAGDNDGYRNLSGRVRGTVKLSDAVVIGAAGFAIAGRSEFDGYDPATFDHSDTRDASRNRLAAGRLWARYGGAATPWNVRIGAALLGSSNRNDLAGAPINRTRGTRRTLEAQVERGFATGVVEHRLIAALDEERETFAARDVIYGGLTDQDRSRARQSLTLEWRAAAKAVSADVALRHDRFSRFKDATTLRASLLGELGGGFALTGSYGEGIAQPSFFDLYGFFPGNFIGNPSLKPESSRGYEASLRFRRTHVRASLTAYRQRLHDEIIDDASFQSAVNRSGSSRRSGVEAEAAWSPSPLLRLSANYALLHATQPNAAETAHLRELRRPKHSGSIAADGAWRQWSYGASLAYVGANRDRREIFPYNVERLGAYALADARVAYALRPNLELFARGSNLFDARYREAADYRTEGRGLYLGISFAGTR